MYRIRNWKRIFEKAQTREVHRTSWVAVPNSFEGRGFRRLMSRPDGIAIYGAWVLIVEIASKCPDRGELVRDGTPLTCEDLALMTGGQVEAFRTAIEVLSQPEIGWIELADGGVDSTSQRVDSASQRVATTGQDITGQNIPCSAGGENQAMAVDQAAAPKTHEQVQTAGHGSKTPPAPTDRYNGSTVWAAWVDMHRARGLNNPARAGADLKAAKDLAGLIPRERLHEILTAYLDDDYRWLDENGHALRYLGGRLNGYLNHNHVDPNTDAGMLLAMDRFCAGTMAKGNNNQEESDDE
jgi:hypothetical protein